MYGEMKKNKIHTSGAPYFWCAISVFHTNGASPIGAPLVYSSGALLPWCAISVNPIYSPFPSSVVSTRCSLSCVLDVQGGRASSLLPLDMSLVLTGWEPFAWVPWGVYVGLPPGV